MAEQLRDQVRFMVPHPQVHMMLDQMSTKQLLGGLAVGVAAGMHFLSGWVPWKALLVVVGVALFLTQHAAGKRVLSTAAARASALSGRHVTESQTLMVVCVAIALAGRSFLANPSGSGGREAGRGEAGSGNTAESVMEAYAKGFADAKEGKKYDPPAYVPPDFDDGGYSSGRGGSTSGGFSIWSIFRYIYLGQGESCISASLPVWLLTPNSLLCVVR
jgi:uncharacterized membrane protein (Fun14 family)